VLQRGPEVVVRVNGSEAARATDPTLARGRLELAFGTFGDRFQAQIRAFRVWALGDR